MFQLKTHAKNPFEVQGVGTQVARRIDGDLDPFFPDRESEGRFAVQRLLVDEAEGETKATQLEEVIQAHGETPTESEHPFEDVMEVFESPVFGPIPVEQYDRPDALDNLATTFADAEVVLNTELEELVKITGVGRGFQ